MLTLAQLWQSYTSNFGKVTQKYLHNIQVVTQHTSSYTNTQVTGKCEIIATAAEEEVGLGRKESMPPAHGRQNEGGEGARCCRLQRGINVGGRWANPPPQDGGLGRRRQRQQPPRAVTAAGAAVSGAPASCRQLGRRWQLTAPTSTWEEEVAAVEAAAATSLPLIGPR